MADLGHVAVCVTTLEGLGRIISRFGSAPARFVLQEYVHRLESILRDGDQLIQINESKYCLLLKNLLDPNHALLAGRKLEEAFSHPFIYLDTPVRLELRAGIASGRGTHGDAEILFRAAEAARETAVAQRIVWAVGDPLDVEGVQRNWRLAAELEGAIEAHHLRLYYQPQVSCADGKVTGAEGLVRWEHRDGLLTPEQFLPHLDASGMVALTGHVIQRGVADLLADPTMPQLAVNLPATQLLDPLMLQNVLDELSLWKVDPERLTLELAEEGLLENATDLMPGLRKLRERGVRIVLDDCGAGRGSLRQFRELPIDAIKLDRGLVAGLLTDSFDAYVTGMLIDFAHFLGLEVVAKGVESDDDIERLGQLGCDHVQGFGVSPPLSVEAFAEWRNSRALTPDS
jgi:EAL domain-containing protein (putative c-di-GMP-specific phosphodiesterase class I)/GGDEF domain-containing protein